MEDLDEQRGRPLQPRNAAPLEMHFEHLLTTDPAPAIVADDTARRRLRHRHARAARRPSCPSCSWSPAGRAAARAGPCWMPACAEQRRTSSASRPAPRPTSRSRPASMPRSAWRRARPSTCSAAASPDDALPALPAGVQRRPVRAGGGGRARRRADGLRAPAGPRLLGRASAGLRCSLDDAGALLGYGYAHPQRPHRPVAAVEPVLPARLPRLPGALTHVLEGRQLVVPGPCHRGACGPCSRPACASTARPPSTAPRGPGPASTATSP